MEKLMADRRTIETAPLPTRSGGRAPRARTSAADIAFSISRAISEHRLQPGAKLIERSIAEMFGVSRTIVREALIQLGRDGLVVLKPGSGAYVSTPSIAEAQQLFAVRRMLETEIMRALVPIARPLHLRRLRAHVREEQAAIRRGDVAARTRLLADFHVEIARCLGNKVLEGLLFTIVTRSSLILLVYQTTHAARHSCDEHTHIIEAIAGGDVDAAVGEMLDHLRNVEQGVLLDARAPSIDLQEALLGKGARPAKAQARAGGEAK
jgi:DNA-binding GntR family transcriptional regulator